MKLLFATNLKGRPKIYNSLISRAEEFTAMFWLGELIDSALPNTGEQRVHLIHAASEIQSHGCRVLASGPQADVLDLCHWFRENGTFIAPGLIVTRHHGSEPNPRKWEELRGAAWDAGALWIVLADKPEAVAALSGADPCRKPDLIVTSRGYRGAAGDDWCEKHGHTWILTPDAPARLRFAEAVLDFRRRRIVRTSGKRVDRRDAAGLFRSRQVGATRLLANAA